MPDLATEIFFFQMAQGLNGVFAFGRGGQGIGGD